MVTLINETQTMLFFSRIFKFNVFEGGFGIAVWKSAVFEKCDFKITILKTRFWKSQLSVW